MNKRKMNKRKRQEQLQAGRLRSLEPTAVFEEMIAKYGLAAVHKAMRTKGGIIFDGLNTPKIREDAEL